ncbi:MAG: hypothetical protein O7C75_18580 [Verrucomicrobia bacterium]|nr:hypothetical protein [Verrucomicrobiota bacterium]
MFCPFNRKQIALIIATILFCTGLNAVNRIAIKAIASDVYTKSRALDKSKKVQTYQFMKGRYHPGTTVDAGMVEIKFEDLVYDIAVNLQKQNYYPVPELGKSDLLIVVHWGRTIEEADMEDMLGYTSMEDYGFNDTVANAGADGIMTQAEMNATADFGFNTAASQNSSDGSDRSMYYKARLLGMEEAFSSRSTPREELLLKTLLQQERYFVALMAYDFQKLQKGELDLLWTTRYSIRAVGQSYEQAITEMNIVAGDFFGKNIGGLTQRRLDDKSSVQIGEIEVIGEEPAEN